MLLVENDLFCRLLELKAFCYNVFEYTHYDNSTLIDVDLNTHKDGKAGYLFSIAKYYMVYLFVVH